MSEEPLWTVEWRALTPKGNVGRVQFTENLYEHEATAKVNSLMFSVAWVWMERQGIKFKGQATRTDSQRA